MSSVDSESCDDDEVEVLDERYVKFSKALDEKNATLISSLIQEEGILQKQFHSDRTTLLHLAAQRGTAAIIKQLCELGAGVNVPNKYGETPIFRAVKNDDIELVKTLIDHGAKVNIACAQGVTPLHLALLHGPEKTLRTIVKKILSDAEKGVQTKKNDQTEVQAKKSDQSGEVQGKKVVQTGEVRTDKNVPTEATETSSEDESMEMSSDDEYSQGSSEWGTMSEDSAESSSPEDAENTESLEGTMGLIKALLKNKKLFKLQKNDYPLLIFFASRIACGYILDVIRRDCRKFLKSLSPAERKRERTKPRKANPDYYDEGCCNVRYVPKPPADINFQGYFDRTALHYAVREEIPIAVEFLLRHGADPNAKTCEKLTPLHYAACLENMEICKILLDCDAYVNVNRCCQGNPLYHVCGQSYPKFLMKATDSYYYDEFEGEYSERTGKFVYPEPTFNLKIMKLMLDNGARPDNRGENGLAALHEACKAGRLKEAKLLLKYDAYLKGVDMSDLTALHHAAYSHSVKMIEFLLQRGFEIDVKNHWGTTPLMSALGNASESEKNCLETIEYLVDRGANINAKEERGDTPLMLAIRNRWSNNVIECLLELGADFSTIYNVEEEDYLRYNMTQLRDSHKLLICQLVLKGKDLRDCMQSFIKPEDAKIRETFEFYEKAKLEVKELRSRKIFKKLGVTYYEFLTQDFYGAVEHGRNGSIAKVFNTGEYKKYFSCFNDLLECRFERAKALRKFVNASYDFLTKNQKLPSVCVKLILRHLDSKDLRIFGRVVNKK